MDASHQFLTDFYDPCQKVKFLKDFFSEGIMIYSRFLVLKINNNFKRMFRISNGKILEPRLWRKIFTFSEMFTLHFAWVEIRNQLSASWVLHLCGFNKFVFSLSSCVFCTGFRRCFLLQVRLQICLQHRMCLFHRPKSANKKRKNTQIYAIIMNFYSM